jgi:hypothetical protein
MRFIKLVRLSHGLLLKPLPVLIPRMFASEIFATVNEIAMSNMRPMNCTLTDVYWLVSLRTSYFLSAYHAPLLLLYSHQRIFLVSLQGKLRIESDVPHYFPCQDRVTLPHIN